jgi:hypothetical protein
MSSTSLRLYPAIPDAAPDNVADFFAALPTVGLIDPAIVYAGHGPYSPGRRFHELIAFRTSHTVIQLAVVDDQVQELGPVDSRGRCRVAFSAVLPEQAFLGMGNTRPPQCATCGCKIAKGQQAMDSWFADKSRYRWRCPVCAHETGPAAWDWRHSAAVARFTLDIHGIRYGEAYPSAEFLRFLEHYLGSTWGYFFCRV